MPMMIPPQQPMNIMTPQASTNTVYSNVMGVPAMVSDAGKDRNLVSSNQHQQLRNHQRVQQPEPVKPKEPIPPEHQILQDVFDGLKTRCLTAASHPVSALQFAVLVVQYLTPPATPPVSLC